MNIEEKRNVISKIQSQKKDLEDKIFKEKIISISNENLTACISIIQKGVNLESINVEGGTARNNIFLPDEIAKRVAEELRELYLLP